ncbi:hypothetical protein [Weissella fermenti]|uniref:Cell surface protein n=2 Tax=Weissella TaxID=46255 RepID=A0ABT6D6C4_9LACO|nr:hypothetical protein [Weissella sp. BK2]MDF9300499.1 hypothetical protein [Weissella sp. BK2]
MKIMSHNHKETKQFKRHATMAMATLTLAGVATLPAMRVLAADKTTDNSSSSSSASTQSGKDTETSSNDDTQKGLTVTPDATHLDKAVSDAKSAGVSVNEGTEKVKVVKASEAADAKQAIEQDYAKQVDQLNKATSEYQNYQSQLADYQKQMNALASDQTSSGVFNLNAYYGGFLNGKLNYSYTYHYDAKKNTIVVTKVTYDFKKENPDKFGAGFWDTVIAQSPKASIPKDEAKGEISGGADTAYTGQSIYDSVKDEKYGVNEFISHNNKTDEYVIKNNESVGVPYNALDNGDGTWTLGRLLTRNRQGTGSNEYAGWTETAPTAKIQAPTEPDKPTTKVTVQKTKLVVVPDVQKDVDAGTNAGNIDGSANGQVFMTGDALSYSLSASALPAGRDQYKSLAYEDPLPDGFSYTGAKAFDQDGKDISDQFTFSEKDGKFSAAYTEEALKTINGNTDKETPVATVEVYGVADKDGVKLSNSYNLVVDGTTFESNEVESSVVDFQAHKDIESGVKETATGQSIAGKAVKNGQKLTYELTADDLPANRAADMNGLKWQDTLPDYVDYIGYKVVNADGKDVTDDYEYKGDNNRQFEIDKKSTDAENADKTTAYKNDTVLIYVKANQDGVNFKNTAHMVLNDNDKVTNTVTNSTTDAEQPETQEETPTKELPNTGSTGLVQQAINWFVTLLK